MATTQLFQKNPDSYPSEINCKEEVDYNTNPRYPWFKQTNFTAGDEDQFKTYMTSQNYSFYYPPKNKDNIWGYDFIENFEKYKDITPRDVMNTFKYIFHKLKKGIYVKIVNNKLEVFLPFSKVNFVNEWGHLIKVDTTKWRDITDFLIYSSKLTGYNLDKSRINAFPSNWYANNCLVRSEYPVGEGDSGVQTIKDMFISLCENRTIPNTEFFVNRRDFPILKKDGTEPYDALWNSHNFPLVSHNYDKFAPILSMVSTDNYADIAIPTFEDWARVNSDYTEPNKKFFAPCRNFGNEFNLLGWDKKIPTAVFRGASTGCGTTLETNPRLKLAKMSEMKEIDPSDGALFLDAGITKWNTRPRKEFGKEFLTTIEFNKLGLKLVPFMTPEEQSNYKYIINVDGHVSAYRLSLEMRMGSVILLVDSPYKMWYHSYLQPYVNYIPVKRDLSNLIDQIKWCKEHDIECLEIVANNLEFYHNYLGKNGIYDYLQSVLYQITDLEGIILRNPSLLNIQLTSESNYLQGMLKEVNKDNRELSSFPNVERSYGLMKCLEEIFYRNENVETSLKKLGDV